MVDSLVVGRVTLVDRVVGREEGVVLVDLVGKNSRCQNVSDSGNSFWKTEVIVFVLNQKEGNGNIHTVLRFRNRSVINIRNISSFEQGEGSSDRNAARHVPE